jgi:16S rRNA (guanine527-N7)-methyltransferase
MTINDQAQLIDAFRERVTLLHVSLNASQIEALVEFCRAIARYCEHTNLVGNADLSILLHDHVLDSLALLPLITARKSSNSPVKILDVGSGAGFPAIVLAIAEPLSEVTMVEAVGKKSKFLEEIVTRVGISSRCQVLNERAESLAHLKQYRSKFDFGLARAVGNFDVTAELILPFLKRGGLFIAQKSALQLAMEEPRARASLPKLGGILDSVVTLDEAVLGKARVLLVARKSAETSELYPRSWARIKAQPLGDRL